MGKVSKKSFPAHTTAPCLTEAPTDVCEYVPLTVPQLQCDQILRRLVRLPKSSRSSILWSTAQCSATQSERRLAFLARKAEQKLQGIARKNMKNSQLHMKGDNSKNARLGRGKGGAALAWAVEDDFRSYDFEEDEQPFELHLAEYPDYDMERGDRNQHLSHFERDLEAACANYSSAKTFGRCPVCMDVKVLLELDCRHAICTSCILGQLSARWGGARVTFNYLQCCLCRQPLAHQDVKEPLMVHLTFKERVANLAYGKLIEDGSLYESKSSFSHKPTPQELRAQAIATMAIFMCSKCDEPFCGGKIDCAQQAEILPEQLRCSRCEWDTICHVEDHRCKLHGHRFAVFKCDFCCDVAVYRCYGTTNFCERCHRQAGSNIYYPCLGADACSLCIPHPRITSAEGLGAVNSFVLGCSACQGSLDAHQAGLVTAGADGEFGYPARKWANFAGGDMLLAAVGEKEVRHRLSLHPASAPKNGGAAECAERLLLLEVGLSSAEALLSTHGGERTALERRLQAVGLRYDGSSVDCANRLLLLRHALLSSLSPDNLADDLPELEYVGDDEVEQAGAAAQPVTLLCFRASMVFVACLALAISGISLYLI
jgi:hypothetical protein